MDTHEEELVGSGQFSQQELFRACTCLMTLSAIACTDGKGVKSDEADVARQLGATFYQRQLTAALQQGLRTIHTRSIDYSRVFKEPPVASTAIAWTCLAHALTLGLG